ncbi:MAG: amidohydrolase family protein [Pseudomonadota bacterium]
MNPIVDSHQHFWRLDRGDYGWLTPALRPIYKDYLPADLAPKLARAGVGSTIVVQAAPTAAETRFLQQLAREHSFIAGVVGWVDFENPNAVDAIGELAADLNVVGLRPMLQDIPDTGWMLRQEFDPVFEAIIDHGLVFDALIKQQHLPALRELTARYPDLTTVLDHAAKPPLATGDIETWKREIAALAAQSEVVCKISGLVTEAGKADAPTFVECLDHLFENFGPKRLMWGSDWPVCELVCSYEDWHSVSGILINRLSFAEREQVQSAVARRTYGI